MKKLMRIALVFALAGATLVGCTKDYSGDISDLNKKVSEQATALSALQTQVGAAQTAADKAVSDAAAALAEAQKKATPAEVAAVEQKIDALIAGDVKDLKDWKASAQTELERIAADYVTKVQFAQELADLKAELEQAIAAGDKVNADAIEALTKKVNKLLADVITIAAPAGQVTVGYQYATFAPTTTDATYKALVAAFPEVKAFENNQITQGGHVPFTVNPESTEFDDTFTYEFVGLDGKTFGTLTEPVEGFVGVTGGTNGTISTKAANGFWTLSFAPTFKKADDNVLIVDPDKVGTTNLSLVVTKGENRAATAFAYAVTGDDKTEKGNENNVNILTPDARATAHIDFAETIDVTAPATYLGTKIDPIVSIDDDMYEDKFIISAADNSFLRDNDELIEEYGIAFGAPGTGKITIANFPDNQKSIRFGVKVQALGINGSTDSRQFYLEVNKEAAADGILAAQEITLNGKTPTYPVRWNLADYNFTLAEKEAFVTAAIQTLEFTYVDNKGKTQKATALNTNLTFYDEHKTPITQKNINWRNAVSFGFDLNPADFWPDTYGVTLTIENRNTPIYRAKSTLTVKNAEDIKVYLLKELCDEDGVLQAVGVPVGSVSTDDYTKHIEYDIETAFVNNFEDVITYLGFVDADCDPDNYDQKVVAKYNWAAGEDLIIPINGTKDKSQQQTKFDYVNKTVRNVVAVFCYFGNEDNVVAYPFQVKVVSPVAGGYEAKDQAIFFNDDPNSFYVRAAVDTAVYVAGGKKGNEYAVINYSTEWVGLPVIGHREYYYNLDQNIESVTFAFDEPAKAAKFIEQPDNNSFFNSTKFSWTITAANTNADATKFEVKALQAYDPSTTGDVVLPATVTITDKWGITEKLPVSVKISIKK